MTFLNYQDYKRYLILNLIYHSGAISRTGLTQMTDYIPAVISNIVKDLLDEKLIVETGSVYAGQGRRRTLLEINNSHICAIGVSISSESVYYIVSTIRGDLLRSCEQAIPQDCPIDEIIAKIVKTLKALLEEFEDRRILGIGICDPGILDANEEYSIQSVRFRGWKDVHLKAIVERETGVSVRVSSRHALVALAEQNFGAAQNMRDFVCLELSMGIGMSFACNGAVVKGHSAMAGEIGHTRVHTNDRMCYCGNAGCMEQSTAWPSLKERIMEAQAHGVHTCLNSICDGSRELTIADVRCALDRGDRLCTRLVLESAALIGLALANVINLLNPECVIFYGDMVQLGDVFLEEIQRAADRQTVPFLSRPVYKVSPLMENAPPIGAATLFFHEFLKSENFQWLSELPTEAVDSRE